MSDSSSDDDLHLASPEFMKTVENIELSFLPEKSRDKYLKAFDQFEIWREAKGAKTYSETTMLSYFLELSKTKKPSTLWSIFSMLKATVKIKKNVQIGNYPKLMGFLKKVSTGHKPKKSKMLSAANIEQFLHEAPDSEYIATKAALIIGVSGACRTSELTFLSTKNVEKHSDNLLLISLPNSNTKIDRTFVIRDEYVKIVEKYQALRPPNTPIDRFFLQCRKGKCVKQPMGCTSIGGLPREIATFLGLKDPELYTGHCFRRTSAALLSDSGADLTTLRRQIGGLKPRAKPPAEDDAAAQKKHKPVKEVERMEFENITLPQSTAEAEAALNAFIKVEIVPEGEQADFAIQDDSFNDAVDISDVHSQFEGTCGDVTEDTHNSSQAFQVDATQINAPVMPSPSTSSTIHSTAAGKQPRTSSENCLEIEKQKLRIMEMELQRSERSNPNVRESKSEDYHFLMSILPNMEQLPPLQKMRLRNKINKALLEEMEATTYGDHQNFNNSRSTYN